MNHLLLPLAIVLLVAAVWGFFRNRTALRNVVFLLLGIVLAVVWLALRASSDNAMVVLAALFVVPAVAAMPFLVVALLANGLVMFRRESRSLGNLLSLLVGLVIVALAWTMTKIFGDWDVNPYLGWAWIAGAMIFGYLAIAFVVYLIASWLYSAIPTRVRPAYAIVLGARLIDGQVPPLLRSRLDRSIELYRSYESDGQSLTLIPSGGQGADETRAEGVGMAEYLVAQGVPAEHVLVEDQAVNTRQNLLFSRVLTADPHQDFAIVTNNYHVFRAALLARKMGMKAHVFGAKTKFYYLPSAIIREFLAILVQYKWLNLLVVVVLMVIAGSGLVGSLRG